MAAISLPESNPPRVSLVKSTCSDLADFIIAGPAFSDDSSAARENWLPSERKLAIQFGVSRPVIREAMKRLELQGLVEIRHGRSTKVTCQLQRPLSRSLKLRIPDDFERLRQLNETRRILEPETARIAAMRADESDIVALEACHRELVDSRNNLAEAAKTDARFHQLIARAAGNSVIALILSSLGDLGETSRLRTFSTSGIGIAIEHHEGILKAIKNRKAEDASRLMADHICAASSDLETSEKSK